MEEKKCENCVFCNPNKNDFLPNDWICGNVNSKWRGYWPPTGQCEKYKEPTGKTVRETIGEDKMQAFIKFAELSNAMWGNENGTKGLETFLNQDSAVLGFEKMDIAIPSFKPND